MAGAGDASYVQIGGAAVNGPIAPRWSGMGNIVEELRKLQEALASLWTKGGASAQALARALKDLGGSGWDQLQQIGNALNRFRGNMGALAGRGIGAGVDVLRRSGGIDAAGDVFAPLVKALKQTIDSMAQQLGGTVGRLGGTLDRGAAAAAPVISSFTGRIGSAAGFVGQTASHFAGGVANQAGLGFLTGLGGMGTALGAAGVALGAFTLAVHQAEKATQLYFASLEINPATGKAEVNPVTQERERQKQNRDESGFTGFAKKSFVGLANWIGGASFAPGGVHRLRFGEAGYRESLDSSQEAYEKYKHRRLFSAPDWIKSIAGNWFGMETTPMSEAQFQQDQKSGMQKDIEAFDARQKVRVEAGKAAAQRQKQIAESAQAYEAIGLESRKDTHRGMRQTGMAASKEAARARGQAIDQAAKNAPYNREQAIEDATRQIAVREGLFRINAEGQYQQIAADKQLGEARKQEGQRGQEYQAAKAQEDAAKTALEVEKEKAKEENLGSEVVLNRAQEVFAATERRKVAEEALMDTQKKTLDLQKAGAESLLQIDERRHQLLVSNYETIKRAEEAEKRQRLSETEHLGLMNPMRKRIVFGIAQKLQRGQQITEREKNFMQGERDLFGNVLQKIGMERGTGDYQRLQKLASILGLGKREQALHQTAVKMENKINVPLNFDTHQLTEEMAQKIAPQMHQIVGQIEIRLRNEMQRIAFEAWTQRRTQFGGAVQ